MFSEFILCCFEYYNGLDGGAGRQNFSTAQLFRLPCVNKAYRLYNLQTVNCGKIQNLVAV